MGTLHIEANKGDIAKTVLMPGDPLRAKYIADNYFENAQCYNTVRNMFGYTGYYKGKKLSVQGSGMGIPSISIYSYELFTYYDVQSIIRIGSAGGLRDDINLKELVAAVGACTDSNVAAQFSPGGAFAPIASYRLLKKAEEAANKLDISLRMGNVFTSDTFYDDRRCLAWSALNVLAVEMEAAGLYLNAARTGKDALCLVTITDLLVPKIDGATKLSVLQRQESLHDMINVALEMAD